LVGEGYLSALSHLSLGRLSSHAGARSQAEHQFTTAATIFESLGAVRDLEETKSSASITGPDATRYPEVALDTDDAIVRRLVDAAALPELLGRETAAAIRDTMEA